MKGLLTLAVALCFIPSPSECWWIHKPKPKPKPKPSPPDHSNGIPCPNNAYQKCLPGFRCEGKSCVASKDKVAFEAYIGDSDVQYPDGKTLVFPIVSLNDGQGYNPKNGIFKAPVTGVYKFSVHVCCGSKKHMKVAIMKGGKQIAVTTVYNSQTSSCSSHSAVAKVVVNEEVKVVARWSKSYLYSNLYRRPSFNGVLMYTY